MGPRDKGRERRGSAPQSGHAAMNVALSPDDIARACADAMWKEDDASKGLGMEIVEVTPGHVRLRKVELSLDLPEAKRRAINVRVRL